jgi:hypothetical protein
MLVSYIRIALYHKAASFQLIPQTRFLDFFVFAFGESRCFATMQLAATSSPSILLLTDRCFLGTILKKYMRQ